MIRSTIVGEVLFHSGWEIFDICISKQGIFKLADIETELFNQRLQASNAQLRMCALEIELTVTAVVDEKTRDRKMLDTNLRIGPFVPA